MNNHMEQLSRDFYEILAKLHYPGISRFPTSNQTSNSIFLAENRIALLSWLLAQSKDNDAKDFTANTEESKIVKWYSNMGICNNPDILMGRAPLQDQFYTLKNILLFAKHVLLTDDANGGDPDLSRINQLLKQRMGENNNIIPSTCGLTTKLSFHEATRYLNQRKKTLMENTTPIKTPAKTNKQINRNLPSLETQDCNENEKSELIPKLDAKSTTAKFIQAYESASNWPKPATEASPVSMDDCANDVHSNMRNLRETLKSKEEISNFAILSELEKREMSLDGIIEDIIIRVEEVSRTEDIEAH